MTLLVVFAVLSIFFSFLCSILEAVLLSITPTFVNVKKQEGKSYAEKLEVLKNDVDKPLIAILTINTVAHTVGAILVGVQAKVAYVEMYGNTSRTVFGITFTEDLMVGTVSTIMTILILVASEIIPKTIGATYWKSLAGFTTKVLGILIFICKYTLILWVLQLFTKFFGKGGHGESVLSREDFSAMADIAEQEGVFQESESKMIKSLLSFKEVAVRHIMTPRTVLKTADASQTIQSFFDENKDLRFSRVPIYTDHSDNIKGYFLKDQLLRAIIDGNGDKELATIQREILVANRDLAIPKLFERFIEKNEHIALVVDEYGSVVGVATQEDVIETLLGLEIMDESDTVKDLRSLARRSWEERAKRLGIITD
ncbi:CNNM domain-containing protein [Wenyingzhuangia sp. IMCC45574]